MMNFSTENVSMSVGGHGSNSGSDPIASFYQNTMAEAKLQRYQLQEHSEDLETLQQRVQTLELHKATQFGQDKIVGFLVGAIVLSLLSMVTTFFFRAPQVHQSAPAPAQASTVQP